MGFAFFPRGVHKGKRLFDLIVSGIVLLLLSPIFLILAILLIFAQGWPVIFTQQRPGYRGNPFRIYKFRTMRQPRPGEESVASDKSRLTGIGRFLRSLSLDELPELWNIFTGDMSFVGPRPLLMQYLPLYNPEQKRRHDVLPGLTGWAQINGRNAITWEEKFALDVWYVDHQSFWLDMKIILLTAWKTLRREGITQEGEATAREWKG
jgi:lipopolysaccharide/colanic/teichoic acid biosynthesis glycosyltransferase